ncbi:MAG: Nucleotidyltransferase/DNA polymerase involved in repair, partial [Dehalococcoidia bacterium]|nr:Nucleotidyltransferase/DNA polymerase involved in repair [Dehalococcoidia bacterium]
CFATIEQQANSLLRGKPIAVAAYTTPNGCIVAPSVEAKALGIKTGMQVREGKQLYPDLVVLPPDPWKYRFVNRKLLSLFKNYTPSVQVKSIDEMNLDFRGSLSLRRGLSVVAQEIKAAIKRDIGEWLTVSVGIAPNRFLAKLAANLHKPDGLDEINAGNLEGVLGSKDLNDLFGIKERNKARLFRFGVYTPLEMLQADPQTLLAAFGGIVGYYWHLRLRGWEIDDVDFERKSIGHSHALKNQTPDSAEVAGLLCKLTEKVGRRMRKLGYGARGIHMTILFTDSTHWHKGSLAPTPMVASSDLYKRVMQIYARAPQGNRIHSLAVSCYNLVKQPAQQLTFLEDEQKKRSLVLTLDAINERYGDFVIMPAVMMGMEDIILDRVAYGGIKDLEEFVYQEEVTYEEFPELA